MRLSSVLALVLTTGGCEPDASCEEDPQAQVLDDRREIEVDGIARQAEVADEQVERDRGWRHRACGREALLLLPDTPAPLPIWGCALVEPIDVLFIVDDEIVEVVRGLTPCPEPCGGCTLVGEGLDVDAVVELPADPDAPLSAVRL